MDTLYSAGHRERLRKRFLKVGIEGLADYEVVELLLTFALPRRDVKPLAKDLLARFGSLRTLIDASPEELTRVRGVGESVVAVFRFLREVSALYLAPSEADRFTLDGFDRLEHYWIVRMGHLKNEVFEVAYLDKSFRLLKDGVERLEEGDVDRAYVYPRKVLENALKRKAAYIAIAHNHPGGDMKPSREDIVLTNDIEKGCRTFNIDLVDHMIVADEKIFSFRKAGLLSRAKFEITAPSKNEKRPARR